MLVAKAYANIAFRRTPLDEPRRRYVGLTPAITVDMCSAKCPRCRYFSAQLWDESEWAVSYRCSRCGFGWQLMQPGVMHRVDRRRAASRPWGSPRDRRGEAYEQSPA